MASEERTRPGTLLGGEGEAAPLNKAGHVFTAQVSAHARLTRSGGESVAQITAEMPSSNEIPLWANAALPTVKHGSVPSNGMRMLATLVGCRPILCPYMWRK